jgi:NAD(P)-dependent dehydrogenase (short-subunit alcohol dehydrogenase family)
MNRRIALITGGNRGIGHAVAAELHSRGLQVVLTARDEREAVRASAAISPAVRAEQLDVTDGVSVASAAERIGLVDVLVCNAGVLLDGGTDPLSTPLELVEQTFTVNLFGGWRVAQAFVPAMVRNGWGRVVFVSSGTATFGNGLFTGAPGYSVSKTAVNGLTTMLAKQTEGSGVLVNAVNPGITRTRMMPNATQEPKDVAVEIADVATLPDGGPTGALLRGEHRFPW